MLYTGIFTEAVFFTDTVNVFFGICFILFTVIVYFNLYVITWNHCIYQCLQIKELLTYLLTYLQEDS